MVPLPGLLVATALVQAAPTEADPTPAELAQACAAFTAAAPEL